MVRLIHSIVNKDYLTADSEFHGLMEEIIAEKMEEHKKLLQAELYEEEETLEEGGGFKIVKARFRGGKLQRRKKVATRPGFTIRNGKMQRMSPAERRNRKMAARRSKAKRRATASRAIMKRKRTLMKRKSMGL